MRIGLHHIKTNKFVLSIGDEGAILTYFKGGKLEQRLFSTVESIEGRKAFAELLASEPKAPIHILLDVMDQSCNQQSLPAVSSLTIGKLVKKRLERDFSPDDIKGAILVGREKTGRKDWLFMFISAHESPPFSSWLHFCLDQRNLIAGIHMAPVEAEAFQRNLNKALGLSKGKSKIAWQFLVLHDRVSGFRQIVFRNGRIVFSRLVGASAQELPGVLAGNIEQEVLNSMEYLRRLGLPENTKMDIFICVSEDIKHGFHISEIKGNKLVIMTPYEMAQKLGLTKAVQLKDQYSDIIFAANFIQQRPILTLHSKITRSLAILNWFNVLAKYTAMGAIPLVLLLASLRFWEIWDIKQEMTHIEAKKAEINQHWVEVQANAKTYDEEATVIRDMVALYKLLSGGDYSPLTTLSEFNSVKGDNVVIKSVNWQLIESTAKGVQAGRSTISFNLALDFYNEGQSLDKFFVNFDQFLNRLETKFSNYSVEYSQLPDKVTVGQVNKVIPIEIRLLGPR